MIELILFFESGVFSLIYAVCLRGLGANTKTGSVWLTVATSGGAVIPAVMSTVTASQGVRYSFAVVIAVFAFGSIFPAYLAVVPAAKEQVDPEHQLAPGDGPPTPSRANRVFSVVAGRRRHLDIPPSEHESSQEKDYS